MLEEESGVLVRYHLWATCKAFAVVSVVVEVWANDNMRGYKPWRYWYGLVRLKRQLAFCTWPPSGIAALRSGLMTDGGSSIELLSPILSRAHVHDCLRRKAWATTWNTAGATRRRRPWLLAERWESEAHSSLASQPCCSCLVR